MTTHGQTIQTTSIIPIILPIINPTFQITIIILPTINPIFSIIFSICGFCLFFSAYQEIVLQAYAPDWLTYLFQIRQIWKDWDQMRWMLVFGCVEQNWMVLALDYQLSFPTSMYEHTTLIQRLILSQIGLLRISRIRYWLTG